MILKDFKDILIKKEKIFCKKTKRIEEEISKLQEEISKLQEKMDKIKYPNFIKIFDPIFEKIKQGLKATVFFDYGPFGQNNETAIYWVKDYQKGIDRDNILGSLWFVFNEYGVKIKNEEEVIFRVFEIDEKMDMEWLLNFVKWEK